jgi:hypothetical protein
MKYLRIDCLSQILTSRGAYHCTEVFGIRVDVLSVYVHVHTHINMVCCVMSHMKYY